MHLKYITSIFDSKDLEFKIVDLVWAPNNLKLAVATADRQVHLFDENFEKKDRFGTKPADPEAGKKSYTIINLAFSPDSTKLAVAQSDFIVYVYKIGEKWGEKKAICNKFLQNDAITCMIWLLSGPIICGMRDGKVRAMQIKTNKSQSLFSSNSMVVSLCPNSRGSGFVSGHIDGSVIRYFADDEHSEYPVAKLAVHSVPPNVIVWAQDYVFASGCDKRILIYNNEGKTVKVFDYTKQHEEHEFTVGCTNPSGNVVVMGNNNKLHIYELKSKMGLWEEQPTKVIQNMLFPKAIFWKYDGSLLTCAAPFGPILIFESVLKVTVWKNKYRIIYVGPSQVLIKSLEGNHEQEIIIQSYYNSEIGDIKIMGRDKYVVAWTKSTLIVADVEKNRTSEIGWGNTEKHEKFYFENPNVCLIFNVGELTLVEYGLNEILASVRTEFVNPHLISVTINDRNKQDIIKKFAYLLDLKTICLMDLNTNVIMNQINHDYKIDWLELSENGQKLLFRDLKQRLLLVDVFTGEKNCIFSGVTFVQWVEGSEVAVAQSGTNLVVWYNIDTPSNPTIILIKGEVVNIVRHDGKTQAITTEGNNTFTFDLDDSLVEFGTAINEKDYSGAVLFLENNANFSETEAMWHNLYNIALKENNIFLAERCSAALKNVTKTFYLHETNEIGENFVKKHNLDVRSCPEVWARLAILDNDVTTAESIYSEQGSTDKAIEMYKTLHKWDVALRLTGKLNHVNLSDLKKEYLKTLLEGGRFEAAGAFFEKEQNYEQAIAMYMKAKKYLRVSSIILQEQSFLDDQNLVSNILKQLLKKGFYEAAAEIYEQLDKVDLALECYRKGKLWSKALELARVISPNEVVKLEEEWGDYLIEHKQNDAAISHFIEAGRTRKALNAAVAANQWKKALHILGVIDDIESVRKYYEQIGQYYVSHQDYDTAEKVYLRAEMFEEVVAMYNKAGIWDKAHKLAVQYLDKEQVYDMYIKQAESLEMEKKYKDAEKLYLAVNAVDMAIAMYKRIEQFDNMVKLVEMYHPDLLQTTHLHLGQQLEAQGKHMAAERHYLSAGEWKAAMNMYRATGMWEEAYRVAKLSGGTIASNQIAFLWSKTLPIDSAIKLLNKYGVLEACIDYACETYQFDFAFQLCKNLESKVDEVHYKYAMALEDDGKFLEAEEEFIRAGKPKEAILMYTHGKNWINALGVAEKHLPSAVPEVLQAQALQCFSDKQYSEFESLLLRAQMPEMIVEKYKASEMWVDALRVCRDYVPNMLASIEQEYGATNSKVLAKDVEGILQKANDWIQAGQHKQAITCLLEINEDITSPSVVKRALLKASDMVNKFLYGTEATETVSQLGPRLIEVQEYVVAAQLYITVGKIKEAIDCFIEAEDWNKARKLAKELDPAYFNYIESKYKDRLMKDKNVDKLADVDVLGALDLLAEQQQWSKCIEKAKSFNAPILHKYIALYATQLLREEKLIEALMLYTKHGTPALPQNFNIYDRISMEFLKSHDISEYDHWAKLRQMLHDLNEGLQVSNAANNEIKAHFSTLLIIAHFYALRAECRRVPSLKSIGVKISVSLLRYSDVIPADKVFYEAGIDLREEGRISEAFVFLNHYLDISEAIEENESQLIDNSDLNRTDFPTDIALPEKGFLEHNEQEHDSIREWILAISMDQKVEQSLPMDERNLYESALRPGETPCIVSGYPIKKQIVHFTKSAHLANKDMWSKLNMASKISPESNIHDILSFIQQWCGQANE